MVGALEEHRNPAGRAMAKYVLYPYPQPVHLWFDILALFSRLFVAISFAFSRVH
jgi:hypothetical protein